MLKKIIVVGIIIEKENTNECNDNSISDNSIFLINYEIIFKYKCKFPTIYKCKIKCISFA